MKKKKQAPRSFVIKMKLTGRLPRRRSRRRASHVATAIMTTVIVVASAAGPLLMR